MQTGKKLKYGLSAAMLALIAAGAGAPQLFDQFISEKEGNTLVSYSDNGGIWTICRGVTRIDGKPVVKGQRLTQSQCDHYNAIERDKALAWVNKHVHIPLTESQKAGIASFCPYNIGPGKCFPSTFYRKLNAGDRKGACAEIRRWVYDGGKDCHNRENQCYGQVIRRDQESALTCWGIDQ
ncbi:glycoside hydrolase family protein [Salmonella enterica]|nr:glycoside hydrolase family protein [Salmonella enterica]